MSGFLDNQRKYCISIVLPEKKNGIVRDVKNYFVGVQLRRFKGEGGRLIEGYFNIWETDKSLLKPNEGVYSFFECERFKPIIGLSGLTVEIY